MDDILAFFKERSKEFDEFGAADLRGLGFSAVYHCFIELVERHGFAEVVHIIDTVEHIVEANVFDVSFQKMLFREVGDGATADDIIVHVYTLFLNLVFT